MRLKTNVIISAIFLGLLAFVYFYEIKGGEQRRAEAERVKKLVDFGDHEVRRLVVDDGDTVVALEQTGERWVVRHPVVTEADQGAVERYLRNLREAEMESIVEDSAAVAGDPELCAKFGLAKPRLRIFVDLTEGALDSIYFGNDSPTERYTYGQRSGPNPQTFKARAWRFDNLDKGLFDLRERRVLTFERDDVRQIRLDRVGEAGPVVLAREAGRDWELRQPLEARADQAAADAILNGLANAKAAAFVAESPAEADLARFGLAGGEAEVGVSLLVGEDRAEKRLAIGAKTAAGRHYARDASRDPVFTVDSTLVSQLRKEVFDLRDRKPLRVDQETVTEVTLARPGGDALTVRRDTAAAAGWRLVSPADREVRPWRVTGLLSDLSGAEVKAFVSDGDSAAATAAAYGLEEPRLTISLQTGEGPWTVAFGREDEGEVYVALGSSVYRVAAGTYDKLNLTLDDVAQSAPAPAAGDSTAPSASE